MARIAVSHVRSDDIVQSMTRTCRTRDMVRRACGKADSSENQEAAYACFDMVLEPSLPTIYHGQKSARGGHTGS